MLKYFFYLLSQLKPYWLILPSHCLLCLTPVEDTSIALCQGCIDDLPKISQGCQHCNLPLPYDGICGQCIQSPPIFFQAITPYYYDFPIAQLITQFKHQRQWPIGHLLSTLLSKHLLTCYQQGLAKPDYLLDVPLAKQRLRQRGFNQTAMIAKWLSKTIGVKYQPNLFKRNINTRPQQQLTAKERYKNLTNVFSIYPNRNLNNLHFAIIDDVITTGTTANLLAALLYQRGAKRVDVYAIARTPYWIK